MLGAYAKSFALALSERYSSWGLPRFKLHLNMDFSRESLNKDPLHCGAKRLELPNSHVLPAEVKPP